MSDITLTGMGDKVTVHVATTAPAKYTPIAVNSGPIVFGQNFHNWGDPAVVAMQLQRQGSKLARYGAGAPSDATVDQLFAAFRANGNVKLLYNVKSRAGASACAQIAKAGAGLVTWLEYLNEATGSLSPADYYNELKAISLAAKAANPAIQICGPTGWGLEGGLGGNWNQNFLALNPWSFLDAFSYHAYYGSPETNFSGRVMSVARMVEASARAAGKTPKIILSEQGYTTGARTDDIHQIQGVIEQYYSRCVWLHAGAPYTVAVTYYEGKDDNTSGSGEGSFGVSDSSWNWKPQAAPLKAALDILHQSTARRVYTIGQNWFVCTDTPSGQYLAAWNPNGAATFAVQNGNTRQTLTLGLKSVVVAGTFPEFS